jgi:predicted 3-demethylubiquinone-9 3-methyltransferase (glyoxalase superfamily)
MARRALSAGGDEKAQQCGWLKDKYGVSWQVVPSVLPEMLMDPDPWKSRRAMEAMLQMKKLDIAQLKRAHAG